MELLGLEPPQERQVGHLVLGLVEQPETWQHRML
jgi:hypothetical protein